MTYQLKEDEIRKDLVYERLCKISDLKIPNDIEIVEISKEIFEKLSYRKVLMVY